MCSANKLNEINRQMLDCYRETYGADLRSVILYGSYARGDFDDESDIDYTAIVDGDRRELQQKLKSVWARSAELGMENDVVISPTVSPENEYDQYKEILPYYRNIMEEGQLVG